MDNMVTALVAILPSTLLSFDLAGEVSDEAGAHVIRALTAHPGLQVLRWTCPDTANETGFALAEAVAVSCTLEAVALLDTKMDDEAGVALAVSVMTSPTLRTLQLHGAVGAATGVAFAAALAVNMRLEHLWLVLEGEESADV